MTEAVPSNDALKFGWGAMKKHVSFFIIVLILGFLVYLVPDYYIQKVKKEAPLMAGLVGLAAWVLQTIVSLGYARISLRICDEEKPEVGDLLAAYPLFFKFLIASLLYSGLCFLAFIPMMISSLMGYYLKDAVNPLVAVFAVAGLGLTLFLFAYIGATFWFYIFIIVDKQAGPLDALKQSAAMTQGKRRKIFLFLLALLGVNILGCLAFIAGLFASIPTTMIASAYLYKKMALPVGPQALPSGS